MSRAGPALFWIGLGFAFWPYALWAAVVAWAHGNGGQYCHTWTPLTDLAMAPAAVAFLASAAVNFDRRRAFVMLAIVLSGPALSLGCGLAHG
jgi:hypothetical protein